MIYSLHFKIYVTLEKFSYSILSKSLYIFNNILIIIFSFFPLLFIIYNKYLIMEKSIIF